MKKALCLLFAIACVSLTACNCGEAPDNRHTHEYIPTVTAPTCLQQGYTTYTCECGKSYKDNYTPALGHDFADDVCTRCGYVRHDHDYVLTVTAPTCTEKGFKMGKCSICGATYYIDFTEPLGHDFVDGKCTRCNEMQPTEGLQFTLSDDGTYYICSGKGTATVNEIYVPSTYNDKPVAAIGDSAFRYAGIEKIKIPDSVKSIGNQAFYFCNSLKSLTIGNGVTSIGISAFQNCSNLTSLSIPDSVTYIGDWAFAVCSNLQSVTLPDGITAINEYTFYSCANLTDVTIPESVTMISKKAFGGCGMESVTVPDGVTSIGDNAFESCQNMTSVTLPAGLIYIGSEAFYNCFVLKDVYYSGNLQRWAAIIKGNNWDMNVGHWAYSDYTLHCADGENENGTIEFALSDDGNYYICNGINPQISYVVEEVNIPSTYDNKPVKEIGEHAFLNHQLSKVTISDGITSIGNDAFYLCSNLNSISIPDSVTSIGSYAFYGCSSLTTVTIPDSVTSIGNYAFYGCTNLTSIYVPKGVSSLESYTFSSCPHLTDIFFNGTMEKWRSIPHTAWLYVSRTCSVHCTDGNVTIESKDFA